MRAGVVETVPIGTVFKLRSLRAGGGGWLLPNVYAYKHLGYPMLVGLVVETNILNTSVQNVTPYWWQHPAPGSTPYTPT